jgi:hypothetical protein
MNKLFATILAFLMTTTAVAAVSDADRALVEKGFNVFRNGGAENGRADWTASGGSVAANSTAKASGQLGIAWNSNGAGQTLILTSSLNVPEGLRGRNGAAVCKVKAASGAPTHTFTVDDGTNNLASTQTVLATTSNFQLQVVNFVYPSTATPLRFKFTSVAADEPEIYVDECVGTDAFNISQVAQSTLVGSAKWPGTANCDWTQTAAGVFPVDADCTNPSGSNLSGQASAPATKIPGIRFANGLPPGEYLVVANGTFFCTNASNNCVSAISLSDGTNRTASTKIIGSATGTTTFSHSISSVVGRFSYTAPQGDTTIQLYSEGVAAGSLIVRADTASSSVADLQFLVYRFPTTYETAYNANLTASIWKGYLSNSDCAFTHTTTGSFGVSSTDGSCTLVQEETVNPPIVTRTSTNRHGIDVVPNSTGFYEVCVSAFGGSSGSSLFWSAELRHNATNILAGTNGTLTAAGYHDGFHLCGVKELTVGTTNTFETYMQVQTATFSIPAGFRNATSIWTVKKITQSIPAPVIVGQTEAASAVTLFEQQAEDSNPSPSTCGVASSYFTRTLNTIDNPKSVTWVSGPSSNQFTLQAGTYLVEGYATRGGGSATSARSKVRLRNITDSTNEAFSFQTFATNANDTMIMPFSKVIYITSAKTYAVQQWCSNSNIGLGLPVIGAGSGAAIYSSVKITKLE